MNYKDEYINWASNSLNIQNTTKQQYVSSIENLNRILGYNIFEIDNIGEIAVLYQELIKEQKNTEGKYYEKERPSSSLKGWYSASVKTYLDFLKNKPEVDIPKTASTLKLFNLKQFLSDLSESGLSIGITTSTRFVSSLLAKPFLILTGLSGSGKTKIAQAFTSWICKNDNQFVIIPVGADWTNREHLLGYPNALDNKEYITPENKALDLLISAKENPHLPYFLILDEMNLSHVERYFADFLSAMESGEEIPLHKEPNSISGIPPRIRLPKNLFIIGTVNIDETTHMFSPKVLDRANTIEFRITPTEMSDFLSSIQEIKMETLESKGANMASAFLKMAKDKSFPKDDINEINKELNRFFVELKKAGAEFGYRSATEILRLINQLSKLNPDLKLDPKLDIAIIQKLLPKLHGSRRKLSSILVTLATICLKEGTSLKVEEQVFNSEDFNFESEEVKYPLSLEKISRMHRSAIENGFASFAEA